MTFDQLIGSPAENIVASFPDGEYITCDRQYWIGVPPRDVEIAHLAAKCASSSDITPETYRNPSIPLHFLAIRGNCDTVERPYGGAGR